MEHTENNRLLIAFYGDDFTGSTDALEFLCRAGIKTILFIDVPSAKQLAQYPGIQAIGIAGITRSLSPKNMEAVLKPTFEALKQLNPIHVHYKVCSTFDSSPTIGSIGKAIDVGQSIFNTPFVPVVVAAPALGRYCLFGNLFARMGIGSDGDIYRLDRHPSMRKHPVTPADESDLRLHLAKQTTKNIGLFNIINLHQFAGKTLFMPDFADNEVVLFDALTNDDLKPIGEIIESQSTSVNVVFSVGSSGVEMALGSYWREKGIVNNEASWQEINISKPILVISGSCSPVTSLQIENAINSGFAEVGIDTVSLAEQYHADFEIDENIEIAYAEKVSKLIKSGENVIVHTSFGHNDVRVIETDKIFKSKLLDKSIASKLYGKLLGSIAKIVAKQTDIERLIIAGGDTSSYAARAMEIEAAEMILPLAPGAPLCMASSKNNAVNNLQIVFKGGQVGKPDFFIQAATNNFN
ncbi:four-carbon acid sugar kinase family protein [Pedobacter sp. Leaf170]|uniref:four-carbon acid sugar kinase family protein n=1 Tax=Pedobacter sp. Leaf170 TaxID=2876558 RepID=UPI001E624AE9|nr:four-carbon acid sugar kinase family protein [Pedobacter sp. Leaf170]